MRSRVRLASSRSNPPLSPPDTAVAGRIKRPPSHSFLRRPEAMFTIGRGHASSGSEPVAGGRAGSYVRRPEREAAIAKAETREWSDSNIRFSLRQAPARMLESKTASQADGLSRRRPRGIGGGCPFGHCRALLGDHDDQGENVPSLAWHVCGGASGRSHVRGYGGGDGG